MEDATDPSSKSTTRPIIIQKSAGLLAGTKMPRLILALCAMLSLFAYKLWLKRKKEKIRQRFSRDNGCQPLRDWDSHWPLGLDLLLKAFRYARSHQILQFFLSVLKKSGTTCQQSLLGATGVLTIDPENIEAILSTKFEDFGMGLRAPTFYPLLGSGIFTQDGVEWQHSRNLLRPQFMNNRFQNFEHIKECVENLLKHVPDSGVVDLQPLFFRFTFDTTMFLLFGKAISSLDSTEIANKESRFAHGFVVGQDYLAHRGRLGEFYWVLNDRTFRDACKTCHQFVDEAIQSAINDATSSTQSDGAVKSDIDDHRGVSKKEYIFIHALLRETQDRKALRDQCLNILLAGRDTTACCLIWTFRLLARHPNVLARLRDEIKAITGLGPTAETPTRAHIKRIPYLDLVLKEVLRLYPSVPVNSRTAQCDTVLPVGGGHDGRGPILVREGEAVGYCVYAMHRRRDIYGPDADEFRPERWEGHELSEVGWGYLPFNKGPRRILLYWKRDLPSSGSFSRILSLQCRQMKKNLSLVMKDST
ncbi:n-alkane-inducible cytochrome P450 [Pseudovirgaria hyperparasitica]|uniref:N-alkane-inducible cytochrome P450 n=1 Tax=Pseudovirgaria hyperparasitica TaxID=470096 RepID=A0A6A6W5K7_9PEZI|nr:n-alkane-inducible cytochrome P450 [Pseudovirgaria hyperparasitica]KAF2757314.1 n-alkane-inducible cytochrome P450 [Pseudovirgaria hyperparasitica]